MDSPRKNIASIMITCKYSRQIGRQNEKHIVPYLPNRHDCLFKISIADTARAALVLIRVCKTGKVRLWFAWIVS